MQVQYYAHCCFALQSADGRRAIIDPYDESIGYRAPAKRAEVTLVSREHPAHNQVGSVLGRTMVVRGAVARELASFSLRGVLGSHGHEPVVCFCMNVDGVRVCHLSAVDSLSEDQRKQIGPVDVLLLPCGGGGALEAAEALEVARSLRPRLAIPMGFRTPFLNRASFPGLTSLEPLAGLVKLERHGSSVVEVTQDEPDETRFLLVPHEC